MLLNVNSKPWDKSFWSEFVVSAWQAGIQFSHFCARWRFNDPNLDRASDAQAAP